MGYIVLDSQFQPFTFEQQIAPYKEYYENAYKQQEALSALETKATALKQIADSHPEWQQEYNDYMNTLINLRDQMYSTGVDQKFIQDSLNASKQFGEMSSMVTADGQKRALTEGLNKLVQQDATAFTSIEGEEPTAYDLRKNPYADQYKTMSGAQLQANVESKAKHYAEQMDYPDFYNTDAGILTEEVSGYTPQEMSTQIALIEYLLSDATFASKTPEEQYSILQQYENAGLNTQLLKFVQDELETSGVSTWTTAAKRKAIHYITNGLWAGVGKNTWDLQKGSSSDGSGGSGGLVLQYTNNPSYTYMGSNLNEGDDGSFVPDKLDSKNSKAYNLRYLANITDEDNNIKLPDGTSVNIMEAVQQFSEIEDVYKFLKTEYKKEREADQDEIIKNNQHLKGLTDRSVLRKMDKLNRDYNKNDVFDYTTLNYNIRQKYLKIRDSYTTSNIDYEKFEESIPNYLSSLYKNTDISQIPQDVIKSLYLNNDFDQAYSQFLMYIDDKDLKEGDKVLKKQVEKANKIQAANIIDFYNLADYLPEKALENIAKYGVQTTYAMDPQNHAVKVNWLLVTDPKGSNTAIAGNLKTAIGNSKGIIFNTDDGLNIKDKDTEGESIEVLRDDMQFDDNGNPKAFRIYLNPAILHYDDYASNNLIKNKYILEYTNKKNKIKKILISGEYLGQDYENLMNEKQFEYSQSDPSTIKTPFRGYDPARLYTDASVTYVRNPDKS